jgi:hypothetical protein
MEHLDFGDGLRFGLGWFTALLVLMLALSLLGLLLGAKSGN